MRSGKPHSLSREAAAQNSLGIKDKRRSALKARLNVRSSSPFTKQSITAVDSCARAFSARTFYPRFLELCPAVAGLFSAAASR